MRGTLAAAPLCLMLATSAWAGYDEGLAAFERSDFAAALREWRPLADNGNADAQFSLGVLYQNAQGIPLDHDEAIKLFRKSAVQGDIGAQSQLRELYLRGYIVPQDYTEAVKWYRRAAEKDHGKAQRALGDMYSKGHGVPQDDIRAHKWFNLAAAKGDKKAREIRDALAKQMTPAQLARARKLAFKWQPKRGRK